MSWELSRAIAELFVTIFTLILLFSPFFIVVRLVKRNSDRRYELERYKAETERMRAEAEAARAKSDGGNGDGR